LNATSVGFKILSATPNRQRGGHDISEAELLEFSVVPCPSNPGALAVRSSGIDAPAMAAWLTQARLKVGRVLSGQNEQHLRDALDHVTQCGGHLNDVLAAVTADFEESHLVLDARKQWWSATKVPR
jgi:hypothetical protein